MGRAIGIDLGTTYSCMAYVNEDGNVEIIKNRQGDRTTPSVVYLDEDGKPTIVGKVARQKSALHPERFIERIKTQMGRDYQFEVDGKVYSPEEISSFILMKLAKDAEYALGEEVTDVVVTVPAYFGMSERGATEAAIKIAGLNKIQLINEPTAAACDYALNNKANNMNRTVMVYDLGGGTFDVTLMKLEYENGEIKKLLPLTSDGNHALGGKNWDDKIVDYLIEKFLEEYGDEVSEDELRSDPQMRLWFSTNSEELKKQLTEMSSTEVVVTFGTYMSEIEITREDFDERTRELLDQTIDLTKQVLSVKNMEPSEISEIILVGGSTFMPQVKERLRNEFGIDLVCYEPNEAVARGAAFIAGSVMQIAEEGEGDFDSSSDSKDGKSKRILGGETSEDGDGFTDDILNKTYGFKVYDSDTHQPLIANLLIKDTLLNEAEHEEDFQTASDNQIALDINIFETESREEEDPFDESLEPKIVYTVNFDSSLPKGAPLKVRFKMNASGVLNVTVTDVTNNREFFNTVSIANCISDEEVEQLKQKNKTRSIC